MVYDMSRVTILEDVPDGWIYSHFYHTSTQRDINQPFDGRTIKVRSFRARDTVPSLCFYFDDNRYKWQDFATGKGGDTISFVADILNKERGVAVDIIKMAYDNFKEQGKVYTVDIKPRSDKKFTLTNERFNARAIQYWGDYQIRLLTLHKFCVRKLANYSIEYADGRTSSFFGLMFGYYNEAGEPYQIYNPDREPKYITIRGDIIPGLDKLTYKNPTLAIVSGLKDLMALDVLDLNIDIIANPTGEGNLIKSSIIDGLRRRYKNIISIMDNDSAGIKSMIRYEKVYNVIPVWLKLSKDLAQNNKDYTEEFLRHNYSFHIDKCINEKK